jgi:hypothetical protein
MMSLAMNFGHGMEALLEPEMDCAMGGDCRQPGPRMGWPAGKETRGPPSSAKATEDKPNCLNFPVMYWGIAPRARNRVGLQ